MRLRDLMRLQEGTLSASSRPAGAPPRARVVRISVATTLPTDDEEFANPTSFDAPLDETHDFPLRTSDVGVELIAGFEDFPNGGRPYNDPVGFATVGFGHLIARRRVTPADRNARWLADQASPGKLTLAEAKRLLRQDLAAHEQAVARHVNVPLTREQFDALVSFVFHVGEDAFSTSTVLRRLNQGEYRDAADALLAWNKAGSPPRALEGLTLRRKAERARFLAEDGTVAEARSFTEAERRWVDEYDELVASRRDEGRRANLLAQLTLQRKRIWRRAQPAENGGDGEGWDHASRERYLALLRRTR